MYLLRKRTVEVYLPNLSIRPQEPRRPRFSFFQSSQCQRTDPGCVSRRRRRWKLCFRIPREQKPIFRLPGSGSALSVNAEQWEQQVLGVVSEAGLYSRHPSLSTPCFQLSEGPNFENLKSLISLQFQWLASVFGVVSGAAVFSDWRVIWVTPWGVNRPR